AMHQGRIAPDPAVTPPLVLALARARTGLVPHPQRPALRPPRNRRDWAAAAGQVPGDKAWMPHSCCLSAMLLGLRPWRVSLRPWRASSWASERTLVTLAPPVPGPNDVDATSTSYEQHGWDIHVV